MSTFTKLLQHRIYPRELGQLAGLAVEGLKGGVAQGPLDLTCQERNQQNMLNWVFCSKPAQDLLKTWVRPVQDGLKRRLLVSSIFNEGPTRVQVLINGRTMGHTLVAVKHSVILCFGDMTQNDRSRSWEIVISRGCVAI
ncbi:hypothetical protein EYR41_011895 [Orbilia oligospora]|uniref:Uncharacterized protein n=1 Tax=Orbilia oligospora TaxID=2813651 RepID=A0A8H2DL82_ORBOL|nr:hypothetical protein EYR41_011895 [Orbilia oligospora]